MSRDQLSPHPAHDSGVTHVKGESEYIADRPMLQGELHVGVYTSPIACGKIKKLNIEKARAVPGVVGIYTAKDVLHNLWGGIICEQPLIANDKVNFVGEVIAVIAAESKNAIIEAKEKIECEIEKSSPLLTIAQARQAKSYIGFGKNWQESIQNIKRGDIDQAFANADHTLSGEFHCNGQEQFYLESQCAAVIPQENNQLVVHSSSQAPTEVQHVVAQVLGLKFSQVVTIVKRMGGAFGGKESQAAPIAAYAALVAHKTRRPARIVLTVDEDMQMTGKRHPFTSEYKVAFDKEGRILGLKAEIFANGGAYADLSTSILERALMHLDNAYYLPAADFKGIVCRTHLPPNTAFRGFGGPQGVATIEHIIEEMAVFLQKDALEIREINCYGESPRNITPYHQELKETKILKDLFTKHKQQVGYYRRRKEIILHNKSDESTLRGMALIPIKFGISFTTRKLNQGSAMVLLQTDGTVQVSTGATEMGQGVYAKIKQIVSEALAIPYQDVLVMPTSTEKNHNTSPTAASSGSDINGAAALKCCEKIVSRLKNIAKQVMSQKDLSAEKEISYDKNLDISDVTLEDGRFIWQGQSLTYGELLPIAYVNRIFLGAYEFYKTPGIWLDKEKWQGNPFYYFTHGVACSEVSVDKFTGELKVLRSDILMDLGRMINPAVDYGQVSGGFIQGMGWATTENCFYNDEGVFLSHSPTTYKIPNIQDCPREFSIEFIENPQHQINVKKSKAVGEPPLMLGISVWAAAKDALKSAGNAKHDIRLPATQEELLLKMEEK